MQLLISAAWARLEARLVCETVDDRHEYIFNVAWECSLMSAQSDDDPSLAFLDQYLQEGEDAAETPF